jgi:tetratricopeptide (TPR) repeat protein
MDDREMLESTLHRARQALAVLEGQAAGYTVLTIPAHLVIELGEKQQEVARLEARLTQLETGAVAEALRLPHNLPRRSEFVGREAYKAQVHAALRSRAYLVSIEGIGGIGKTSLALEVAYECLQASTGQLLRDGVATFEGFIWMTAQGHELTLHEVLDAVARTLNYPGIAQKPLEEKRPAVCRLLQTGRYLLVVDNYETIADKAIHDFLLELPEPTEALITTREQKLSRVSVISLKGLEEVEALALLRSEGRRLGMTALQQAEDAVLLRLYQATGGAPLALKWAVGQIKQQGQSLDAVLEALYDARGDIFDHIFARSWQLLSPAAQRMLMVMPLFIHSASREALEAASDLHHFTLDEALGQLVEMSLVDATDNLDVARRRYSIHPLTRAFARAHLAAEAGRDETLMARVAAYYDKRCAELAMPGYYLEHFDWFEVELPNILTVIEWAYQTRQWHWVIAIFPHLYFFLGSRGYWQELIFYGESALAFARQSDNLYAEARCLDALGWIFNRQGHLVKARQMLDLALESYTSLGDNLNIATALIGLAKLSIAEGNLRQAQQLVDSAPGLAGESAYEEALNSFLAIRGRIEWYSGNFVAARELLLHALAESRKQGFNLSISSRLIDLGHVALDLHEVDEALRSFQQGLVSAERYSRQDNIAKAKFGLARVHDLRGQHTSAKQLAQEARDLFLRLDMRQQLEEVDTFLHSLEG